MTTTIRGTDNSAAAPALTGNDSDTGVYFPASDVIALSAGGAEKLRAGATEVVVNDTGANLDFRVEGDTDANLLFVDASTDRVGVGTNTPARKLEVGGEAYPVVRLNGNAATGGPAVYFGKEGTDLAYVGLQGHFAANTSTDLYLRANTGSGINFFTNGNNERMSLTSDGYLRMASGSGGIQFGGDTAAANALDDYEEGTWTPTALGETTAGTTTYTLQQGSYTKIGRMVIASARLGYSALTGTGELRLGGLPFTSAADSMEYMSSIMTQFLNWSGNTSLALYVGQNITHASIFISGDDVGWLAQQCVNESADFRFTAIYFTA